MAEGIGRYGRLHPGVRIRKCRTDGKKAVLLERRGRIPAEHGEDAYKEPFACAHAASDISDIGRKRR